MPHGEDRESHAVLDLEHCHQVPDLVLRGLMLVQLAWSILLWPLARRLWDAGREKLVGYGG